MLTLLAALFLPLFPLSMVLNAVLARLRHPLARFLVLLLWPQIGVLILHQTHADIPPWLLAWALFSAALYALRMLTCRELERHASLLATSALALTWLLAAGDAEPIVLAQFAFWISLPAALSMLLADAFTKRFGAAYAGLCPGLGQGLPRLSGVLAVLTLAAVATPPFPGFFMLLGLLGQLPGLAMIVVLCIWLFWGWSAARLLQGFIAGECREAAIADLNGSSLTLWAGLLLALGGVGLYLTGGIA